MPKYKLMTLFLGDRPFTALNLGKCMMQLQSLQPTITFRNFLRGYRRDGVVVGASA